MVPRFEHEVEIDGVVVLVVLLKGLVESVDVLSSCQYCNLVLSIEKSSKHLVLSALLFLFSVLVINPC